MTPAARIAASVVLMMALACPVLAGPGPKVFPTPEDAAKALVDAAEHHDTPALVAVLGSDADELINSGDPVQDRARRERFARRAGEALRVEPDPFRSGRLVIVIGKDGWPVPLPLIKVSDGYRFDVAGAKLELLARRVGRNELDAIATLRALVGAELEYAYSDLNRNGIHDYARQILSDPGRRNGLYWDVKEGEPESPLARMVGRAAAEGYEGFASGGPLTYHGYVFRLLEAQGPHAPGGARNYVVRGLMLGGFAFVAHPLDYGVSGIKTFVVSHDGVVWEKDLGARTTATASALRVYDPDKTWRPSPEPSAGEARADPPR
jgi:hypothetical protein